MTDNKLAEALEIAINGLRWYQDRYPGEANGCDDEAMATINAALAAYADEVARPKLGEFDARDSVRAHPDTTTLQRNADEDMQPAAQVKPPEMFTRWFTANYPGPGTIISDPGWHAPRIFRAASYALMLNDKPTQPAAHHDRWEIPDPIDEDPMMEDGERVAPESIGYAIGWNACRRAMIAATQEHPND